MTRSHSDSSVAHRAAASPSPFSGILSSPSPLRGSHNSFGSHTSSHTRSPLGPACPFIFQPPRTPSKQISATSPLRRSFVFSEWAASNKQTFVFEGAHSQQTSEEWGGMAHHRRITPCKFVPTKALTMAMQDAPFVKDVLKELPGVDASDPRILSLLERIKEKRQTTASFMTSGRDDITHTHTHTHMNSLASSLSSVSLSPCSSSVSTRCVSMSVYVPAPVSLSVCVCTCVSLSLTHTRASSFPLALALAILFHSVSLLLFHFE